MFEDQSDRQRWQAARQVMVEQQLRARGVRDARVLEAMGHVSRETFLPALQRNEAYEDRALPIEHGQTISQPFMVGYMTSILKLSDQHRVLEVGTGSGYQTAILARLAREVLTIERLPGLRDLAAERLARLGVKNVRFFVGDGSLGLPEHAPFDRILVTAGSPRVPAQLVDQLVEGGLLVMPVGGEAEQTVTRVERRGTRIVETPMLACRFVKLLGEQGWALT